MKKKILLLILTTTLLCLSFCACGASGEDVEGEFLLHLVETVSTDGLQSASEALHEAIREVDTHQAEHMIMAYTDYLYRYINGNPDKIDPEQYAVYYDQSAGEMDEEKLAGSGLEEYYRIIRDAHLKIIPREGKMKMFIDYDSLLEEHGDDLSQGMQKLLQLEARTVDDPMTENATLRIGWEEILDRALTAEGILKDHSDNDHIRADAVWLYKTYVSTLLMGSTNSPIFSQEDGSFSEDARAAYEAFLAKEKDSGVAQILSDYMEYLQEENFVLQYGDSDESRHFFEYCDYLLLEAEQLLDD